MIQSLNESMSIIRILPESVANKIAAGEVVERPASVVKELLENSIDAGASRIDVYAEAGGKRVIRIEDDGCGMSRDDALLAFERHATSKIKSADDLFEVTTLGFRGEALPAIASVSRLTLATRHSSEASGTQLEIAGGKLRDVKEITWPGGTRIETRDLFFNTPARRKFLKSESTELGHIAGHVTHYALAHPEKSFRLASMTHEILNTAPAGSLRERLYQVMGKQTLDTLVEIEPVQRMIAAAPSEAYEEEAEAPVRVRLSGFISRPEVHRLNRNQIYFFVNRRLVRDRLILHAITEAYRNILPSGVFPIALLFLELPATEVDVNVHPSKTEVRFRHASFTHDFARDAMRAALLAARPMAAFPVPSARARRDPGASFEGNDVETAESMREEQPATQAGTGAFGKDEANRPMPFRLSSPQPDPETGRLPFAPEPPSPSLSGGVRWSPQTSAGGLSAAIVSSTAEPASAGGSMTPASEECGRQPMQPEPLDSTRAAAQEAPAGAASSADEFPKNLRALGQVRESFIVATNDEGLWIIDQHVAHERVLFEKHLRERLEKRVEGQRLLLPIVVELNPEQQATFESIAQELLANGFEAEPFGKKTIAIKSAPSEVRAEETERLLIEILDGSGRDARTVSLDSLRHRIAASVACHAAIKVNMPLTRDKMEWLLRELGKTKVPMACPHGRPILLRYSMRDIEKAFKRI